MPYDTITIGQVSVRDGLIDAEAAARLAGTQPASVKNWWRTRGVRGPAGGRIRLASITTPSGVRTTKEAVAAFLEAYHGGHDADPAMPGVSPVNRARLQALGLRVGAGA